MYIGSNSSLKSPDNAFCVMGATKHFIIKKVKLFILYLYIDDDYQENSSLTVVQVYVNCMFHL